VKANGDAVALTGLTVPEPFSVIVTAVAEPPNVFPLMVTGVVPHVLPLVLLRFTNGGLTHPHVTEKLVPVVVQPDVFLTVMEWVPLATFANTVLLWYEPASSLYS
jgi:hypothetical protein